MDEKKPRIPVLGLAFDGGSTEIAGIEPNDDGSFTFIGADGKPLQVRGGASGLSYARSKGPKIIYQIPEDGHAIGSMAGALGRFDLILGADTNTRDYRGDRICVSTICQLRALRFEGDRWSARVDPISAIEFHNPTKDAERIGWRHAIALASDLDLFTPDSNVLLVVDCHLGDHPAINRRDAPLIGDELLLPGFSLAYASSDATTDSPINGLIAFCDRMSRAVLNRVMDGAGDIGPLERSTKPPFHAFRYWKFVFPEPEPRAP